MIINRNSFTIVNVNLASLHYRPGMFKRWIVLLIGQITIQEISRRGTSCVYSLNGDLSDG